MKTFRNTWNIYIDTTRKVIWWVLLQPPPIDSPTHRPPTTLLLPIDRLTDRHQLTLKQKAKTLIISLFLLLLI